MTTTHPIFTIGHSTHSIADFVDLLRRHGITAVGDVRSTPASRFNAHFNRDALTRSLKRAGIGYVFLGRELGARSEDPACYVDGKVQYGRLAASPAFEGAIERLKEGRWDQRIAIMCAEREPLDCHRTVLVARRLSEDGVDVLHVLGDGAIESHGDAMMRLRATFNLVEADLFHTAEDLLRAALRMQEDRIAYVDNGPAEHEKGTA